ncbi:MAG: polysaccharide biosynthesis tyrosine autokinase [Cohaesibacter sp.]|jgi:exopolysaccharide transport family protein|nr:polysaccharide biosynthesis tyrosine autokinase [Cohaesibacter sp.]
MLKQNTDLPKVSSPISDDLIDDEIISIHQIVDFARRHLKLIATVTLFFALLGVVLSFVVTPQYTASVSMLIDTRSSNVVDVDAVLSGIGEDDKLFESQLQIIKSASVAERVANTLNLRNDPEFQSRAGLLSSLFSSIFPAAKKEEKKEQDFEGMDDEMISITSKLQANLSVQQRRRSLVVDVSYRALSPQKAARIANAFVAAYRVDHLETKYDATKRANDWLNTRLAELREKVRGAEQAVAVYRAENNLQVAEGLTINEKQIGKLNEQLILARAKTAEAQAKVDQIAKVEKKGGSAASFADALQSQVITQLRSKASEIGRELAQLTAKYGGKHPSVISVRSQLSDIRRQINAEVKRIVSTATNELEVAKSREKSILDSLEGLKTESFSENKAAVYLRELEREAEASQTLYQSFLNRFKETQAAQNLDTTETRVLAPATPPRGASFPNKKMFLGFAALFGLFLGIGIALLIDLFDFSITEPSEVERQFGVPLFASMPIIDDPNAVVRKKLGKFELLKTALAARFGSSQGSPDEEDQRIRTLETSIATYSANNPLSAYSEAVRNLRSRLRYVNIDEPVKVVMVSSAVPGEGKSTTASNLAHYAAKTGERVLLIDGDFRHPVVTKAMAPETKISLLDVITGQNSISEAITYNEETNLYFMPAPLDQELWQSAEILSSDAMRVFVEGARKSFDLVIIDTSPILPVLDGRALASLTDGAIIVSEFAQTNKNAIKEAIDLVSAAHGHVLGITLNSVDLKNARGYGYGKYGKYGYGSYGYGQYGSSSS